MISHLVEWAEAEFGAFARKRPLKLCAPLINRLSGLSLKADSTRRTDGDLNERLLRAGRWLEADFPDRPSKPTLSVPQPADQGRLSAPAELTSFDLSSSRKRAMSRHSS